MPTQNEVTASADDSTTYPETGTNPKVGWGSCITIDRDRDRLYSFAERPKIRPHGTRRTDGHERLDPRPSIVERAARAALSSDSGLPLTDREWARMRARLLEFVTTLRAWDQQSAAQGLGVNRILSEA